MPKKRRSGAAGGGARSGGGRSGGGAGRAGAGGAAVTATLLQFGRWYQRHLDETGSAHDGGHASGDDIRAMLATLFEVSGGRLRSPRAEVLETLLDRVEDDDGLWPRMPEVLDALEHYLDFAVESGSWDASDDEIDASDEVLALASESGGGMLVTLIEAMDDVDDVEPANERPALQGFAAGGGTAEGVADYIDAALAEVTDLAAERVLGLLCVAALPELLPGRSTERIVAMLDVAVGAGEAERHDADAATHAVLERFENDGLLRASALPGSDEQRLEAAPGLRGVLADAVVEIADARGLLPDANPHAPGTGLAVTATVVAPEATAEGAVWRRLVFAADTDLGGVHLALQLAFEWDDEHPHRFRVEETDELFLSVGVLGGESRSWGGASGVDPSAVDDLPEGAEDELEVQLGELLVEPGDELDYEYDGDADSGSGGSAGVRVRIRLEEVLEPDAALVLPRCVASSGDQPVEEIDGLLTPLRLR
ncbi:plasmid pRiA4b ORF-3 family protein [Herbiconiux sp. KACC 21604]|uniref:plasmid pRiA4b ORF-3 family protein n=1 Tax=unclassified Herbiconiux TaxID=2618217 RepID=UPI001491F272|nr:plasmid pRiA4b ORF-3 family protein [Herbiconiux sp. SALV-R1]QJU53565.1 plasmid pRiA4b ORF-3 family protein [Herbiconiux sp. SALV-R1]WPO88546.1 plasmid pRiA4b ORF-3 family protein [Herbiconiux sp. KACC 21604]